MSDDYIQELLSEFDSVSLKLVGRDEGESDQAYVDRLRDAIANGLNRLGDSVTPTIGALNRIKQAAKDGQHPAEKIREDTAKSWAGKEHHGQRALGKDDTEFMAGKGGGVARLFDALDALLESSKELKSDLEAPEDGEKAGGIYDAYSSTLDDVWSLLHTVEGKLENSNIRKYIGPECKKIFAEQVKVWEVLGPKIVSVVGPKLEKEDSERTTAKLEEWGTKTLGYMKQCVKNASA